MPDAIAAISKSSASVTHVMGTLNTTPKQAHIIFSFFLSFKYTPNADTDMTTRVVIFVNIGNTLARYKIPSDSSINGYT